MLHVKNAGDGPRTASSNRYRHDRCSSESLLAAYTSMLVSNTSTSLFFHRPVEGVPIGEVDQLRATVPRGQRRQPGRLPIRLRGFGKQTPEASLHQSGHRGRRAAPPLLAAAASPNRQC